MGESSCARSFVSFALSFLLASSAAAQEVHCRVESPPFLGVAPTDGYAGESAVANGHLFAVEMHGGRSSGLQVYSLRDPRRPARVASLALRGRCTSIAIHRTTALLACESSMHVVDVSQPARPRRIESRSGRFYSVRVENDRAVVLGDQVVTFDLSGRRPRELARGSIGGSSVALDGAVVWVSVADGVEAYDVATLARIGRIDGSTGALDARAGQLAIAASHALLVYDVSAPRAPRRLTTVALPFAATSIALEGRYVYLGGGLASFHAVDLAASGGPALVLSMHTGDGVDGLTRHGDLLYASAGTEGIRVVDVRDPWSPHAVEVGTFRGIDGRALDGVLGLFAPGSVGTPYALATHDGSYVLGPALAVGARFGGGTQVLHAVVTPTHRVVGTAGGLYFTDATEATLGHLTPTRALLVDRDLLWAARSDRGVDLFAHTPSAPAAHIDTEGVVHDLARQGSILAVADARSGLALFDVADPLAPRAIGAIPLVGSARIVRTFGRYFVTVSERDTQHALPYDVSTLAIIDPATSSTIGSAEIAGTITGLAITDGQAFVATERSLQVYDLGNPSVPELRAEIAGGAGYSALVGFPTTRHLVIDDDHAIVAGGSGFVRYRLCR